jgi:3-oxoadipate enol-lactonase
MHDRMNRVRSGDAEIAYEILGDGPPIVLLHPFPTQHTLWLPAAEALTSRYRVILPDLRGHGESSAGEGPGEMEKHAADVARVLDDAGVGRAVLVGWSIGGYILFECWRRYPERIVGIGLCNTRPQADTAEGRAVRLRAAADVMERGTEAYLDTLIPKLFGQTSHDMRPDRVASARAIMRMPPKHIAQVQEGMASRPDSVPTLSSIHVPTLIVMGEEDVLASAADGELMRQRITGSELRVVAKTGHYTAWERPDEAGRLLRQFADGLRWT